MEQVQPVSRNCFLQSLDKSGHALVLLARKVASWICWYIANRGGLTPLCGLGVVPAQWMRPRAELQQILLSPNMESFVCQVEGMELRGVVMYPEGWDRTDRSRAVLCHNGNAATIADAYLRSGQLMELYQCPVIRYDYRGTGLNRDSCWTTPASLIADGRGALDWALNQFQQVHVVGVSLGGAVATIALEEHLSQHPANASRVSLMNHDSFTMASRVVFPNWPRVAQCAAWISGWRLDAAAALRRLAERAVSITLLCHDQDPVISAGARIANFAATLSQAGAITILRSHEQSHGEMTEDFTQQLASLSAAFRGVKPSG